MQQICNFVTEVVYIFKHWLIIIKIIAIVQRGITGEEHILLVGHAFETYPTNHVLKTRGIDVQDNICRKKQVLIQLNWQVFANVYDVGIGYVYMIVVSQNQQTFFFL